MNSYDFGSLVRVTTRFYVTTILVRPMLSTDLTALVATDQGFPGVGHDYIITVDHEDMLVTAGQGTTGWTVTRGVGLMPAVQHSDGSQVSTPADPSTVAFTAMRPDGSAVPGTPVQDTTGIWHADFSANYSGRWVGKTVGSGAVVATSDWIFFVRPLEVS